jgi:DNA repair exonuclease SbcCD ATPase subunit
MRNLTFRTADPAYISALQNQLAEKDLEHKQLMDLVKAREVDLITKIEDLNQQLELNAREAEKQKSLQQEYRKLLNDILGDQKRNSITSQSSIDSYRSASAIMTGTSKTELTSDYGDHYTLDQELAQADSEDEEEPDHTQLIADLKAKLKEESRLSTADTVEHSRAVKDLKQEFEDVRSTYEEEASELQKTLTKVKSQLLLFTRQRSLSESSGSGEASQDKSESTLAKVRNLQRQIAQQREDHKEVLQLLDTAQTLAVEREAKANELTVKLETLQNDYNHQSSQVNKLATEIAQLHSQNAESLKQLESAQQNATELEKKVTEIAGLLESVKSERDTGIQEISVLRTELEGLGTIKDLEAGFREEIQNLKKDNSEYLTIIQHLKDQVSDYEASISTNCLEITSLQQKLAAAGKDADRIKRAKVAAERDLKGVREEVGEMKREREGTKNKLAEVSGLLDQLQKDYDSLKKRKSSSETDALVKEQAELIQALDTRLAELETRPTSADPTKRLRSGSGRWSNVTPTPPPAMPLPPLPGTLPAPPVSPTTASPMGRTTPTMGGRSLARPSSQDQLFRSNSRDQLKAPEVDVGQLLRQVEEKDQKIVSLEKQFQSERQLVQTLEEALSDTEKSMKQLKKQTNSLAAEKEVLHTKMLDVSHQLEIARKETAKSRDSVQQLDEARAQRAKVPFICHPSLGLISRRKQLDDNWRIEWKRLHKGGGQNFRAFSFYNHLDFMGLSFCIWRSKTIYIKTVRGNKILTFRTGKMWERNDIGLYVIDYSV